MRVRLIQPPLVQPRYRQLTLPVVGALLEAQGLEVETCDENVQPLDRSAVDLVGISCHVYNAPRAFAVAREFRGRGVPVVLGGTFPTVAPQLCQPHCDSVVVGELENQAAQLVADARAGELRPVYRAAGPPDLGRTVRPNLSLINNRRYLRFNFPVELSRGCRFACRFCTNRALFSRPRTRTLAEIERDLAQHDHGLIEVVDINFLNDALFLRRALPLLGQAPGPGWTGQTTVADLAADPALPELLARSRCRAVFIGLESISERGLRSVNKAWSRPAAFLDVARRLREVGVLVQVGLIVGLDDDRPGDLARTADFLEQARVQSVAPTYLHYYPGTPPFEALRREGRLLTTELSDYDGNHPVVRPLRMSVAQLRSEVEQLVRRFYAPGCIGRRALHGGMRRQPVQLLHHLMINGALSSYYREVGRSGPQMKRRYMTPVEGPSGLDKVAADAGSWLLERLWSL